MITSRRITFNVVRTPGYKAGIVMPDLHPVRHLGSQSTKSEIFLLFWDHSHNSSPVTLFGDATNSSDEKVLNIMLSPTHPGDDHSCPDTQQ